MAGMNTKACIERKLSPEKLRLFGGFYINHSYRLAISERICGVLNPFLKYRAIFVPFFSRSSVAMAIYSMFLQNMTNITSAATILLGRHAKSPFEKPGEIGIGLEAGGLGDFRQTEIRVFQLITGAL